MKWLIKQVKKAILKDIQKEIDKIVEKARTDIYQIYDWATEAKEYVNSERILDDLVKRLKGKQLK